MPPLLAIFAWPVVAAVFFGNLAKPLAVLVTILAGFLLLPELTGIDLPLLPLLDKATIPGLAALVLSALVAARPGEPAARPGLLPRSGYALALLALLVMGAFVTVLTNADSLYYGPRTIAGLQTYDSFSTVLTLMMLMLPVLLARKYLGGPEGHRLILKAVCIAALGYSLLALIEIRLSPQMNNWVYGFFPHSWAQHVRAGGYRPLVFLSHGLVLAMVFVMAILAATGLSRIDGPRRTIWLLAAGWLMATLALSNSLGALVIALTFVPVVMFLSVRAQLIAASVVAVIFMTYPVLRGAGLIPVDAIVAATADLSDDRAQSFEFRVENEDILLDKASQRPVFGWGGWGRARVYDTESGQDMSITDGYWVILIGNEGWVGYIGKSGLLALPILLLAWRSKRMQVGRETSVLTLMLAANLIDLLPNAGLTPLTWILAGALWGRLEHRPEVAAASASAQDGTAVDLPLRPGMARPRPAGMPAPTRSPRPPSPPIRPATAYTRQAVRIVRTGPALRR